MAVEFATRACGHHRNASSSPMAAATLLLPHRLDHTKTVECFEYSANGPAFSRLLLHQDVDCARELEMRVQPETSAQQSPFNDYKHAIDSHLNTSQ